MNATNGSAPLLDVSELNVLYPAKGFRAPPFQALHDISIQIHSGETLGLVGESGSGKSTLGKAILGLTPISSGSVHYDGRDITHLKGRARRALSSHIQVVFQDPYSSMNPAMTVQSILAEPLRAAGVPLADATRRIRSLLDQVQMPAGSSERYPGEFSGGQRQRVAIARALALEPKLIVCDEPVSALDLSTQARVLDLLGDLQRETGIAYLFVTHDLGVVRYVSHRVAVMNGGCIVESGDTDAVTSSPAEAYTAKLMLAAPVPDPTAQAERRRHYRALADRAAP